MDELPDTIANAEREAKAGDYRAMAGLFAFVCARLWERVRQLEQEVERQGAELEKRREPW